MTADPRPEQHCVIGDREHHSAHDGLLVCRNHLDELGRFLREIEDEAAVLEVAPSLAISYERSSGGLASEQAPVRLDVVAYTDPRTNLVPATDLQRQRIEHVDHCDGGCRGRCRARAIGPFCLFCDHDSCKAWRAGRRRDLHDDEQDARSDQVLSALAVLHAWADNVRDDRKLTRPEHVTLSGERNLLTRQLVDWVARQYYVADFYDELQRLTRSLKRANNTVEVHAGTCDTLRPDGELCGGKVWHVLVKPDGKVVRGGRMPGPDDEPGFRCATCRRVWTGTEAVRKRHDMWLDEQKRKTEKGKISS
jgi:hypothetical protein